MHSNTIQEILHQQNDVDRSIFDANQSGLEESIASEEKKEISNLHSSLVLVDNSSMYGINE